MKKTFLDPLELIKPINGIGDESGEYDDDTSGEGPVNPTPNRAWDNIVNTD